MAIETNKRIYRTHKFLNITENYLIVIKMIHEKKVWKEYFKGIINGTKKFEIRLNDCGYQTGDEMLLREWDNEKQEYTGYERTLSIKYLVSLDDVKKFWSKKEIKKYGIVVLGL
ncbi:hypothetical protein LCGC14_1647520 [marine sediment metagenome]|uniref:DUF3850 domain-containing protein n=1 Tax=marine sediment metagenome TaxID=412755 RepID=A0A0F9IKB8_9ZZZZ